MPLRGGQGRWTTWPARAGGQQSNVSHDGGQYKSPLSITGTQQYDSTHSMLIAQMANCLYWLRFANLISLYLPGWAALLGAVPGTLAFYFLFYCSDPVGNKLHNFWTKRQNKIKSDTSYCIISLSSYCWHVYIWNSGGWTVTEEFAPVTNQ